MCRIEEETFENINITKTLQSLVLTPAFEDWWWMRFSENILVRTRFEIKLIESSLEVFEDIKAVLDFFSFFRVVKTLSKSKSSSCGNGKRAPY